MFPYPFIDLLCPKRFFAPCSQKGFDFCKCEMTEVFHEIALYNLCESKEIKCCLLYTSDAADERSSVDLGGRRIIKKKKK